LGFFWPLFKDLNILQLKALAFGNKLQPIKSNISKSSNIYPLANTFDKMSHQIVENMQMHQDLSRTIAHEIRTPLARMKFVSELISEDVEAQYKSRLKADINEIEQLMEEYLSFERIDHKHFYMEKTAVDVNRFFAKLADKYRYQHQDITISFDHSIEIAFFNADAMARALQNLLNNALRYAQTIVKINFYEKDGNCIITVADDGDGVGKEAKKLIQPFVRNTTSGKHECGYGLGLYIVRKIIVWHQGQLELNNSVELKGAEVKLFWPNNE